MHSLVFPQGHGYIREEMEIPVEDVPCRGLLLATKPLLLRSADFANYSSESGPAAAAEGVRSICCIPLITRDHVLGSLNVASLRDAAFSQQDLDLLTQVASQVAIAVENALAFEEIAQLKNKLAEEKLYLEDEIRTETELR